jgi:hypothetical protein
MQRQRSALWFDPLESGLSALGHFRRFPYLESEYPFAPTETSFTLCDVRSMAPFDPARSRQQHYSFIKPNGAKVAFILATIKHRRRDSETCCSIGIRLMVRGRLRSHSRRPRARSMPEFRMARSAGPAESIPRAPSQARLASALYRLHQDRVRTGCP